MLVLSLYCGRDFDKMGVLLAEMQSLLQVLLESLFRTLGLVSCEHVVRIYTSVVYDAACQYSVNGVMWVFVSSLVMAIFGLIMILLRSAYKPTRYVTLVQEEEEEDGGFDGYQSEASEEGRRLT